MIVNIGSVLESIGRFVAQRDVAGERERERGNLQPAASEKGSRPVHSPAATHKNQEELADEVGAAFLLAPLNSGAKAAAR